MRLLIWIRNLFHCPSTDDELIVRMRRTIDDIPPEEIDAYMEKMMSKMKKVPYITETSGSNDYNLRFNLQNMTESIWIPVRDKETI